MAGIALSGRLSGRLSGGLADNGDGGAPAFSGVVDAIIAAGGTAPNFAGCISHRLYTLHTSALIRVRRANDNAQLDIPYNAITNLLDEAAIAAHCGANDGFIVTVYDQSGNGRDVTQATTSRQPKIYDGATGTVLKQGSLPWPLFVGASLNGWSRGDSSGVTGGDPISFACFCASAAPTSTREALLSLGTTVANQYFLAVVDSTNGRPMNMVSLNGHRTFTPASAVSSPSMLIHQLASGAQVGASTVEQDDSALAEFAVSGGTQTTAIGSVSTHIGTFFASDWAWDGGMCAWILSEELWTGGVLAAIRNFGASLKARS